MDLEKFREYCLSQKGAVENLPRTVPQYQMFVTYTVGGKWFVLEDIDKKFIDVKASPETIAGMQERYEGAFPAWHMNKQPRPGVKLDSDVPDDVIFDFVKSGYDLIVKHLPGKVKQELNLE